MCEPGKGSEPRPRAGVGRAPRPAQPRGPRVALPSQGSQERAAQKTLAGGVSGCWGNGFRETVPSKARQSRGGAPCSLPGRGRWPEGARVATVTACRGTPGQGCAGRAGGRSPVGPAGAERPGVAVRRPAARQVRRSPWRRGPRRAGPLRLAGKQPRRGPGTPLIGRFNRRGWVESNRRCAPRCRRREPGAPAGIY